MWSLGLPYSKLMKKTKLKQPPSESLESQQSQEPQEPHLLHSLNFPKPFTLAQNTNYALHQPFDSIMSVDIQNILVSMVVYVSETDRFNIKLRDIFKNYILIHYNADSANKWLKGPNMGYWDQQLNFAVWLATTGCGVSIHDHLYNDDIPKQIQSFFRFHVYFTIRRILNELSCPLPDDPDTFNKVDNLYDVSSYHRICDEFGLDL